MKQWRLFLGCFLMAMSANAQHLKLKKRDKNAMTGTAFAHSIADTSISLAAREALIFNEIKLGNVPDFLRSLSLIKDTLSVNNEQLMITYYVLPDYIAIGSNNDFFYTPMTPMLAQRIANLAQASLPTRKVVDKIYANASIKLEPRPIPPTPAMVTVPVFAAHNAIVMEQLKPYESLHHQGALTAGNKKDIVLSNKIYGEKTPRVVIYGWHKPDGKTIQPVYNKHKNTWADYSHGIRLVQNKLWVNGKKTTYARVLAYPKLAALLSDEGVINISYYPVDAPYDN